MIKKGILKVFISSTYSDLKSIRKLIIDRLEKSLTPVAMETFVPVKKTPHEEAIRYLEDSDICIFIIGDYYGSIINKCKIRNEKCGDCKGNISYTFCEYLRASHLGKPCMAYILKNEIIDIFSDITKFDLGSNCEIDIKTFLERNNISLEKMEIFRNYSLEELRELWELTLDSEKNKKKLNDFKNEVKNILVGEKKISNRQDFLEFYDTVLKELRKNIIRWYQGKKISFNNFYGRRDELKELLNKLQNFKSVCVIGAGGFGKSSLVQLALLIEKLSGKKIYAFYKEYTYNFTQAGYIHAKGRFEESTFHTRLSFTNIIAHVFAKDIRLKKILQMDKKSQIIALMNELNNEKAILFIDDLQDAENEVKDFVYSCGSSLIEGRVVAVSREMERCFSVVGPLKGIKIKSVKKMIFDCSERYSTFDYIKDSLDDWVKEIYHVTRGHPILIDMIVRNIILIGSPEKLKDFTGVLAEIEDQKAINEFMERFVYHILNKNEKNVIILLSVFREPVNIRIFEIIMNKDTLNPIIKKGFLKRKGDEITYESELAKEFLETSTKREHHKIAIKYYSQELKHAERSKYSDILIEKIYHLLKIEKYEDANCSYSKEFFLLKRKRIKAIEIAEILLGKSFDPSKSAPLFKSLGNLYLDGNEFVEAKKSYIVALKIYRELAQKDPVAYRPYVATTLNNLGALYGDLKRFQEAEDSFRKALKIRRELAEKDPGAYRPYVATTLNNLGNLYSNLGRFEEAKKSYIVALKIYRELAQKDPGAYRPYVATTLNNLGNLYSNLGRFEEAEDSYRKALKIRRELAEKDPGAYRAEVATTLNNLGVLYRDLKRFQEAEDSYRKALKIYRELAQKDPGAYRPYVATTLNNLGVLYGDLKRFQEAEDAYTKALKIRRELAEKDPGANRLEVATTLNNLGNLYGDLKRFQEAEDAYTKALEYKDVLPDEGARIFFGMAELMKNMGRDNSHELYFVAGVVSFNVFTKYGLHSINILSCFQNAYELAANKSTIKRMACIALAVLTQNTTKDKLKQKIDEIKSFNLEDLPNICHAVVNLFVKGETIDLEKEKPSNNLELMFYNLYLILKKCNKNKK